MNNLSRATSPIENQEDKTLDLTLRPKSWNEFIGQDKDKEESKDYYRGGKEKK